MRVLVVTTKPPDLSSGGGLRTFHLLRSLARHHDVTLLTGIHAGDPDCVPTVKPYCEAIVTVTIHDARRSLPEHITNLFSPAPYYRGIMGSTAFQTQFSTLIERQRFDVVQVENLRTAYVAAPLRGVKKILDLHNVESVLLQRLVKRTPLGVRRALLWSDALKLPAYQRRIIPQFDESLVCSEADAQTLRRLVPGARISVIPNGVDPGEFSPQPVVCEPHSLVFIGSFTYHPNADAMVSFCRDVLPRIRAAIPEVRLSIVGRRPGPEVKALERLPGVDVTGQVPDVRPYLARAAVVIVPLHAGSGTRLKILEAMAMGKPVVSTSIGAEGLDVCPGHDLEIADGVGSFADTTVALLRDPERRVRIGINARRTVTQQYAWSVVADQLDRLYQSIQSEEWLRQQAATGAAVSLRRTVPSG